MVAAATAGIFALPPADVLYLSTNWGKDWLPASGPTNSGKKEWSAVACSADGTTLLAATTPNNASGSPGLLFVSTNSGGTWTVANLGSSNWTAVASSADGTRLAAAAGPDFGTGGTIHISTNSGISWSQIPVGLAWESIVLSADGRKLAAATRHGSVCTFSNSSGSSWILTSSNAPCTNMLSLASSADGSKLIAAAGSRPVAGLPQQDLIYRSTNSGTSWQALSAPASDWQAIASSADGSRLVAALTNFSGGAIYTSNDGGATWTSNSLPHRGWTGLASSADGNLLAATTSSGSIFLSRTIPAPVLRAALLGGEFQTCWTVPSMNFVLQGNSDLTTTNWVDVSQPPVLDYTNLAYQVIVPVQGTGFQRLILR
jgi:hypothetical protein